MKEDIEKEDRKNVVLLGVVSFINDTSSKIILPVLPLFIRDIGGGGIALGLISGLGESVASIFKMIAGFWSDRMGRRKPFVFFGYFISSLFVSRVPSIRTVFFELLILAPHISNKFDILFWWDNKNVYLDLASVESYIIDFMLSIILQ